MADDQAEDKDEPDLQPQDKRERGREEWVRGLDHVLPIDYTHGNWCGPVEKLVEMLDSGEVGIEDLDVMNLRPLHKAAARSHIAAMEVLLARGADVNAQCNGGETPLIKAKRKGHQEAVELLIKHGAEDLPVPPPRTDFSIPGYELKPCGVPTTAAAS
jgi:hypothetical protein